MTLYKLDIPDKEINLFNLLEFVTPTSFFTPKAEYFRNEKDIEECYKKQLNYLSDVLYENFDVINDFFNSDNFEDNIEKLEKYMIEKYPDLFKKAWNIANN